MSYRWDRLERNDMHAHEREEERDAMRYDDTGECPPGQHRMAPDGRGGGQCECGFAVDTEEVS